MSYVDAESGKIEIRNLEQMEIVIYNTGTRDISEPLEIKLHIKRWMSQEDSLDPGEELGFWRLVFEAEECKAVPFSCGTTDRAECVIITLPFLNSYSAHQHYFRAWLICEHEPELVVVKGVGQGWSVRCVMLRRYSQVRRIIRRLVSAVSLGVAVAFIGWFAFRVADLPFYSALLKPTPSNLETLIELLSATRQKMLADQFTYEPFSTDSIFRGAQFLGISAVFKLVLGYVALIAYALRRTIATKIADHYFGVKPFYRFRSGKTGGRTNSRIQRAVRELLKQRYLDHFCCRQRHRATDRNAQAPPARP